MSERLLDFRSDTVTLPTPGMRAVMAKAAVADDVYGEDPTVNALQECVASLVGKEAALFVPSGTMSNLIGLRLHCGPGDEFICEANCHICSFEQGGYAQFGGVCARPVEGVFGVIQPEQLHSLVRADNEHLVRTRLVCLENTSNRGGGRVLPYETVEAICRWARSQGLATHLDGARLFNAVVASGIPAREWARHFDTVSVCFSKGLGAPVGSALCGPRDLIAKARRFRKVLGGGMRQAGVIAAGALYALEHHIDRLAEDHENAQRLAAAIREIDGLSLRPPQVDTNLVIFTVDQRLGSAAEFSARLKQKGVLIGAIGPALMRACTHLDVSAADVDAAAQALREAAADSAGKKTPRAKVPAAYA